MKKKKSGYAVILFFVFILNLGAEKQGCAPAGGVKPDLAGTLPVADANKDGAPVVSPPGRAPAAQPTPVVGPPASQPSVSPSDTETDLQKLEKMKIAGDEEARRTCKTQYELERALGSLHQIYESTRIHLLSGGVLDLEKFLAVQQQLLRGICK